MGQLVLRELNSQVIGIVPDDYFVKAADRLTNLNLRDHRLDVGITDADGHEHSVYRIVRTHVAMKNPVIWDDLWHRVAMKLMLDPCIYFYQLQLRRNDSRLPQKVR